MAHAVGIIRLQGMVGPGEGQRLVPIDFQIGVIPVQAAGEQLHRVAGQLLHHGGVAAAGRHAEAGIALFTGCRILRRTGVAADDPNRAGSAPPVRHRPAADSNPHIHI